MHQEPGGHLSFQSSHMMMPWSKKSSWKSVKTSKSSLSFKTLLLDCNPKIFEKFSEAYYIELSETNRPILARANSLAKLKEGAPTRKRSFLHQKEWGQDHLVCKLEFNLNPLWLIKDCGTRVWTSGWKFECQKQSDLALRWLRARGGWPASSQSWGPLETLRALGNLLVLCVAVFAASSTVDRSLFKQKGHVS